MEWNVQSSIVPPGRFVLPPKIRWFPLADSLHHRLISVAPPAHSGRPEVQATYQVFQYAGRSVKWVQRVTFQFIPLVH